MIAPVQNGKIEGISESAATIESKAYIENSAKGRLRSDRNNCLCTWRHSMFSSCSLFSIVAKSPLIL